MTEADTTDHKETVSRLYEDVWSLGDLDLLDEILADSFTHLGPAVPKELSGREGYKEFVGMFRSAFPDTQIDTVESVAEGNRVAVRWLGHGTHEATFMGIDATNSRVATPGVSFVSFDERKIREIWDIFDTHQLFRQLGVADDPAS